MLYLPKSASQVKASSKVSASGVKSRVGQQHARKSHIASHLTFSHRGRRIFICKFAALPVVQHTPFTCESRFKSSFLSPLRAFFEAIVIA